VLETAIDSWAFDDLEEARESPETAGWAYVDKTHFRCLKCHHQWRSTSGSPRPYAIDEGRVLKQFKDDDAGYQEWLASHPDGYVLNTTRHPTADYLMLHRARCDSIVTLQAGASRFTGDYIKVCSTDRQVLRRWAVDTTNGNVTFCQLCL
jgi:hypothetical protein